MADSKITALTALTAADPVNDMFPIVDVSDTSMAASGTTKRISVNNILGASGTATLASATITGALTVNGGLDMQNATILSFGGLLTITSNTASGLFIRGRATGGITFQESTGANPLLNMTNAGVFTFSDGAGGTRMTLNSTGLGVGVTPSAGRGAIQLSAGVAFPATQVASSDVNCLDDYEEGTWTPTVSSTAGTLTTTTVNSAAYTKIGRLVSVQVDISIVNIGTASGLLLFSLPTGLNQVTDANVGALRELGSTGSMGQIIYQSATQVAVALYNNGTLIVNGYRFRGTYTYTTAT
jgi:hypothetical protein